MANTQNKAWLAMTLVVAWLSVPAAVAPNAVVAAAPRLTLAQQDADQIEPAKEAAAPADSLRVGYRVLVPLPINSRVANDVKLALQRLVDRTPAVVRPTDRPIVVLEFETDRGKTGSGSEFEACVALARVLVSPAVNRLNTVAYVPNSRRPGATSELAGHAVLVAICANQLAMDEGTLIGNAGVDEPSLDPLVLNFYQGIASKRRLFPLPIVEAMLDAQAELFRVTTDQGTVFVDSVELAKLESSGAASETKTLAEADAMARLTSEALVEDRLIQHLAQSRTDLARQLDLEPGALEGDPTGGRQWRALHVKLPPYIDARTTNWTIRSLRTELAAGETNLVILDLDDAQGDLDACLRLARHLSEYDANTFRTVAHVKGQATGPVGLLALATDHLLMAEDATLGGHDAPADSDATDWQDVKPEVQQIARDKQRDWSMLMAMLDPGLTVNRVRNRDSGQVRLLSMEELESVKDANRWAPLGELSVADGVNAETASQLYLARSIVDDMDQLKTFYQLDSEIRTLQKSKTDVWIENVAATLSSPMVAPWLLFGAMFLFSSEMSAPGLGVPGFLSAVCVMLFFWSQYLDGNADAVEILLFVFGVGFILIELFVVPGFGIFGVGGLVMVVASIILASQKFLLPRTAEEIAQLPRSMMPVLAAGLGFFAAMFALRNVIPNSPYLNRLILDSRRRPKNVLDEEVDHEAVVDLRYLSGRTGQTVTRLAPSGKAKIDGRVYDVISKGQMIDKDQTIVVVEAVANRVVVAVEEKYKPDAQASE